MRKLLAALLFALPSLVAAQVTDWQTWPVSWRRWDAGTVLTLGYTTIQNDAVSVTQRSILNVIGGGCVDNAGTVSTDCTFSGGGGAPTDADYLVGTANGSLSAEIVVGTTPGGELGGTWASPTLDDNVTVAGWTCTTCTALATDTLWDTAGDLALGSGANTAAKLAVGVEGQQLGVNSSGAVAWLGAGVSPTAGPCAPTRNTACFFEDFYVRGANALGATIGPVGNMSVWGAATAGLVNAGAASSNFSDGNHPGVASLSTGTATNSWAALWGGNNGNPTTSLPTLFMNGGEVFETLTNMPVLSGTVAVDVYKSWWGFGDVSSATAAPTNGLYVYIDPTVDTHFGCGAASTSGGAATETLSNLVGAAATWYTIRIEVNAAHDSVAYSVNGTPLSCSPLTGADLPVAAGEVTAVEIRVGAHAGASGCDAVQDCQNLVDYVYFFDPSISR